MLETLGNYQQKKVIRGTNYRTFILPLQTNANQEKERYGGILYQHYRHPSTLPDDRF
jgi:hypothetical protein